MLFDTINFIHMLCVTLSMKLTKLLDFRWILKNPQRAHLIPNENIIRTQFSNSSNPILAIIRRVNPLRFGTDSKTLCLPLKLHFNKNRINPLKSNQIHHPQLLKLILIQQVLLISTKIQKLYLIL